MKFAGLLIFLCSILSSQNLSILKEINTNNYSFSKSHINQTLENTASIYAAGLLNLDNKIDFYSSYKSFTADKDISLFSAGVAYKYSENSYLSFNWTSKSIDDYIVSSKLDLPIKLGSLSDNVFTLGYGYRYNDKINLGVNVSFVRSAIIPLNHKYDGETIEKVNLLVGSLSGSYLINSSKQTHIVASVQNIGGEKSYSIDTPPVEAPTFLLVGISSILKKADSYYLYGSSNFSSGKNESSRFDISLGIQLSNKYDFHIDYISDNEFVINDNYFSFGAGFKKSAYKVNLSYETYDKKKTLFEMESRLNLSIEYSIK